VTGLTVVDTQGAFSLFGEVVILSLIQVGGLGFMTMSTLVFLALGKRITFRERLLMKEALNVESVQGIVKLAKYILGFTFTMEAIGALFLALRWSSDLPWGTAIYYGIFHAVSAFCNAGFDLFSVSLQPYRGDVLVNLVITFLIIVGGIGFAVISEVLYHRRGNQGLSLHTRLATSVTAFLLVIGFLSMLIFEFNNPASLGNLPVREKVLAAYFQAVVPRTAGFSTIDIGRLRPVTQFVMIILMFIGASPGSTGGGIKTTTFGSLLVVVYAVVTGKVDFELLRRRIPAITIFKALVIFIISVGVILAAMIALLSVEQFGFLPLLFEVTSAFGTVGLSTGITSSLSTAGKVILVLVMYIGRVGPLTLAFALAERFKRRPLLRYPEEQILVG
ncbi:MAG: Trk family potassium uptake protein, partial [Clostridia bacterium]|nr:Trk family potassium uptake protein [Clostridia bacterium]